MKRATHRPRTVTATTFVALCYEIPRTNFLANKKLSYFYRAAGISIALQFMVAWTPAAYGNYSMPAGLVLLGNFGLSYA